MSEQKENTVIEIIDNSKTPTKKNAAANRLANSPKTLFPSTPEKLKLREELAQKKKTRERRSKKTKSSCGARKS